MDDTYLKNRFIDLAGQADRRQVYTFSHFLSLPEQDLFLSIRKELPPISAKLEGFHESAIRKIAVFGSAEEFGYEPEAPVCILKILPKAEKFAETLSHRDYLGAVMSLGIEREMTGDIIIRGKEAWIFVLSQIADHLVTNLTLIRHTPVICRKEDGKVPALKPEFDIINTNLASGRLDLVIAAAAGCGREAAKKLLSEEKVFVNGRTIRSAGYRLKEGDEIVIRGTGKFLYDGILKETKKGRLNIRLRKYK